VIVERPLLDESPALAELVACGSSFVATPPLAAGLSAQAPIRLHTCHIEWEVRSLGAKLLGRLKISKISKHKPMEEKRGSQMVQSSLNTAP
jgi:hypothetical protein